MNHLVSVINGGQALAADGSKACNRRVEVRPFAGEEA